MTTSTFHPTEDWTSAWPDLLAFAFGLAMAWWGRWTTTDLVWSLWLSSLVVGYSTILWTILRPAVWLVANGKWREGTMTIRTGGTTTVGSALIALPFMALFGLFLLAFFTVHFGFFHYIHSQFLGGFFPIQTGTGGRSHPVGIATYVEVVRRYWLFLPAAFLAERAAFFSMPAPPVRETPLSQAEREERMERVSRLLDNPAQARDGKKARGRDAFGGGMMAPYRNVMRMHLLIFFFGFAHAVGLESFPVYAVVYVVYFFPWRLVRRESRHLAEST